jgi:hypothetical protein
MQRMSFMPGITVQHPVTPVSSVVWLPRQGGNVRIVNDGKVNVWIEYGGKDAVADPAHSMLLTPGYTAMMRMPPNASHLAAVCPAKGSATLNITLGDGS